MFRAMQADASVSKDARASSGWLNRNVVGMGLTSFLSDAGHEMATAVLPGFLAAIAAPNYVIGVIEGFADALSSFVKLGAGWWSDRLASISTEEVFASDRRQNQPKQAVCRSSR
jgi:hypothetical protein